MQGAKRDEQEDVIWPVTLQNMLSEHNLSYREVMTALAIQSPWAQILPSREKHALALTAAINPDAFFKQHVAKNVAEVKESSTPILEALAKALSKISVASTSEEATPLKHTVQKGLIEVQRCEQKLEASGVEASVNPDLAACHDLKNRAQRLSVAWGAYSLLQMGSITDPAKGIKQRKTLRTIWTSPILPHVNVVGNGKGETCDIEDITPQMVARIREVLAVKDEIDDAETAVAASVKRRKLINL